MRQRLNNVAKQQHRPTAELLQYFAMERFLYRLAQSPHRDRFVLKGAMMLVAWRVPVIRPTMDIDLLGRGRNQTTELVEVVRELCRMDVAPPDGLVFAPESVVGEQITVESEYVGVRLRFLATLGTARVRMQIDVGFGDAVLDAEQDIELPTILDFPAPRLTGYSRETAIAEKLNAMFQHGRLNSRMKDYLDIGLLARHFAFDGDRLRRAIEVTFARRGTALDPDPIGLRDEFAKEPGKQVQWAAFLRKIRAADAKEELLEQIGALRAFLGPALAAMVSGELFTDHWPMGGPWSAVTPAPTP
ncbi:MAG TPA: nucleotidyl transferase AbiEii/AbiGii toxin family protein [Planctomycetota bacterium]|nr:nucleotidyl transferase AbiEii/AbiGii toxin family protein [Planctomycetota bacterium]